jgi:hypothetical protein
LLESICHAQDVGFMCVDPDDSLVASHERRCPTQAMVEELRSVSGLGHWLLRRAGVRFASGMQKAGCGLMPVHLLYERRIGMPSAVAPVSTNLACGNCATLPINKVRRSRGSSVSLFATCQMLRQQENAGLTVDPAAHQERLGYSRRHQRFARAQR